MKSDRLSNISVGNLVKITGRSKLPLEKLTPYIVLDIEVDESYHPILYEFKLLRSSPVKGQTIFYWCNKNFSSNEHITKRMKN